MKNRIFLIITLINFSSLSIASDSDNSSLDIKFHEAYHASQEAHHELQASIEMFNKAKLAHEDAKIKNNLFLFLYQEAYEQAYANYQKADKTAQEKTILYNNLRAKIINPEQLEARHEVKESNREYDKNLQEMKEVELQFNQNPCQETYYAYQQKYKDCIVSRDTHVEKICALNKINKIIKAHQNNILLKS
ncbi:MAG: hypothetical protein Q8Q60_02180 [Candidatus Chromulinivorax sp.]|nr:hypothetical protein [Candidatus Chromulinivorax sp.]